MDNVSLLPFKLHSRPHPYPWHHFDNKAPVRRDSQVCHRLLFKQPPRHLPLCWYPCAINHGGVSSSAPFPAPHRPHFLLAWHPVKPREAAPRTVWRVFCLWVVGPASVWGAEQGKSLAWLQHMFGSFITWEWCGSGGVRKGCWRLPRGPGIGSRPLLRESSPAGQ